MPEVCQSCKAPVVWARTPNGSKAPIDRDPSENGNTLLLAPTGLGCALAVVLSKEMLANARALQVQLRLNHWASCPDREEWRERTDQRRSAGATGAAPDRG